jgi:hypothetical protein
MEGCKGQQWKPFQEWKKARGKWEGRLLKGKKKIDKMISEGLKSLADIVVTEGKLVREKIRESR